MTIVSEGNRPGSGEELGALPLHFIWIVDCSNSMNTQSRIQALNFAIEECLPHIRQIVDDQVGVKVFMRALRFSDGVKWHVEEPTDVQEFRWEPLVADGVTEMGRAFKELAKVLHTDKMPRRGLPPVLVLVSDGEPTDEWEGPLKDLLALPWAMKAVKIAIGIGNADMQVLQKFLGNNEAKPLRSDNAKDLVSKIKWAATSIRVASQPKTGEGAGATATTAPQLPPPPVDIPADPGDFVWGDDDQSGHASPDSHVF